MVFQVDDYASLRRSVEELCAFLSAQQISPEGVFDCKLVAFELLGNVLKHSQGGAKFHGEVKDGFIELRIFDESAFFAETANCSSVDAENGRGLFLVDNVCAVREKLQDGGILIKLKVDRK